MKSVLENLTAALSDRYAIERELGSGGMALVYLAKDRKHQRTVALKVLRPEFTAAIGDERFLREIEIAAQLNHPHILPLHDSGEAAGYLYYVMPYVEGESLRDRLEHERQLPIEEAVQIACEVADALDYAHNHGIVHRDVKPGNIMMQSGHAVVTDFGIARAITSAADERITATGLSVGTPSYMSPEQAAGDSQIDGRSDIYGVGCVLYEMLAGQPPFVGPTPLAVLAARMTDPVPRVSMLRPKVPRALERVVTRALARVPADRHATAGELRSALQAALHDTSTTINSLAVLPFSGAGTDPDIEYLSDGIAESIINKLSRVENLRVLPRASVFRFKGCDDPQDAARKLGVSALVTGRVQRLGENLIVTADLVDVSTESQLWGEHYRRKVADIFEMQKEMAAQISQSLQLQLSGDEVRQLAKRDTDDAAAYESYLRGRYYWNKRSEHGFTRAIDYFQQAIDQDPGYALALAGLADTYSVMGYYNDRPPRDAYPKAKDAATRALKADDELPEAHASLGFARLFFDWDWPEAEKEFLRAIELNPKYATAHQWYGWYLLVMERFDECLTEMQHAHHLDPLSLIINDHLGYALFLAGKRDEAITQLKDTLELDATYALSHWRLGSVHLASGNAAEAVAAFRRAVDLSSNRLAVGYLGQAEAMAGNTEEAEMLLRRLQDLSPKRYVSPLECALTCDGLGQPDRVFEYLHKAHEDRVSDLARVKLLYWSEAVRTDDRFAELLGRIGPVPVG